MVDVTEFTEAGQHVENEDAFGLQQHPQADDCWICALADGQGGRAGGAKAAVLACETIIKSASTANPSDLASASTWASFLQLADETVSRDPTAGFTTLVGFAICQEMLVGA